MSGGISGDRIIQRISGIRSISCILERDAKIVGGDEAEEVTIACHGNFEGKV